MPALRRVVQKALEGKFKLQGGDVADAACAQRGAVSDDCSHNGRETCQILSLKLQVEFCDGPSFSEVLGAGANAYDAMNICRGMTTG